MSLDKLLTFLHSRNVITSAAAFLLVVMMIAWATGAVSEIEGDRGLLFPSANNWLGLTQLSSAVNLVLIIFTALLAQALNKRFNVMRSMTGLWGALFLVMAAALINITSCFNGGTMMVLTMLLITWLLYSCYDNPDPRRRIFLIFFLLATGGTFQYAFLLYIPILALGMVQMKVFNLRTVVAAILGLLTPPWIIIGFGIVAVDAVRMPTLIATWGADIATDTILTIITIALIALLGVGFFLGNVFKLLSYNARNRAFNGFQTLLLFSTIILALVDYTNLAIYALILSIQASYQIAHFFSLRRSPRSSILILAIFLLFIIFSLSTVMS